MNKVRKIDLKWKQWKFNFLRKLVSKYGKTISTKKTDWQDGKEQFERSILRLLKRHKIIDSIHGIQNIDIKLRVTEYPDIKIRTILINKI
ncbi:hypothetical protein LCGC14_2029810 [marine sediment metagenome]|uniref:Uncharacterized protein n=1 Tax=marine sediment metagenome TaxID=412755 RepID=A0A0F9EV17_9ZZZZ